jgi:hypothetical protein
MRFRAASTCSRASSGLLPREPGCPNHHAGHQIAFEFFRRFLEGLLLKPFEPDPRQVKGLLQIAHAKAYDQRERALTEIPTSFAASFGESERVFFMSQA